MPWFELTQLGGSTIEQQMRYFVGQVAEKL